MSFSFNQVTKRVFIGGGPANANDIQSLIDAGISAIIDVRQLDDESLCLGALRDEVMVLYNPAVDDGKAKPVEWFERSIFFAQKMLSVTKGGLYCHCDLGINRGPSTAYAILRAQAGLFPVDAKAIIRLHRPVTIGGIRYAGDADTALVVMGYDR